ncbi:MAG: ABC transporter substrate-binding protein [Candidatus Binatia bacterium]
MFIQPAKLTSVFLTFLWLCVLCAVTATGATPQEIIDGAKRERELVLYASLTLEEANVLLPRFEAKYPFLKVQFARAGSERLLTRVLTEARAKKRFADVVQTVEFSMHTLKAKGVLGHYAPLEGAVYPKEFKEDDFWISFYYHPYVVAYNKNLLRPVNAPRTYQDLLQPAWKSKMMMEGTKSIGSPACCKSWGARRVCSSCAASPSKKCFSAQDTV